VPLPKDQGCDSSLSSKRESTKATTIDKSEATDADSNSPNIMAAIHCGTRPPSPPCRFIWAAAITASSSRARRLRSRAARPSRRLAGPRRFLSLIHFFSDMAGLIERKPSVAAAAVQVFPAAAAAHEFRVARLHSDFAVYAL